MRKLYYILSLFLVFSCMNNTEKSEAVSYDDTELDTEVFKINEAALTEATLFSEQDIAYQKLQEFYDLNLLKLHHPEFEEDISKQIAEISNSKLDLPKLVRAIKISNLKQHEAREVINDSVSKFKLSYSVQSEQKTYLDSITAKIKTSTIIIDGVKQKTFKVTFEKD